MNSSNVESAQPCQPRIEPKPFIFPEIEDPMMRWKTPKDLPKAIDYMARVTYGAHYSLGNVGFPLWHAQKTANYVIFYTNKAMILTLQSAEDESCDKDLLRELCDGLHQVYNHAARCLNMQLSLVRPPRPDDQSLDELSGFMTAMHGRVRVSMRNMQDIKRSIAYQQETYLTCEYPVYDMFPMDP